MGPKKLKETLVKCVENKKAVLIKGAPGVGKTDIIKQVAEDLGYDLQIFHPAVSDPTDYKGQPWVVDGLAEFLPYGELRTLINATEPTIAFLDDIGQAPPAVQAALMQLLLARRVNGHVVSDQVVFLAATNRRQDRAGVTSILEPVKSRFKTILELMPEKEDWIEWALQHDMPEALIGFINFRPNLLMTEEATTEIINHPCPRTLAHAGEMIKIGLGNLEVLSGTVGQGCAVELTGFMRVFEQLPNIQAILLDPEDAIVPTDPSAQYAVTAALVGVVEKDNINRVLKYGNRLPREFTVLLVKDTIRKNPKLQNTKAFIEWCNCHQDDLL
jgi:hypothetical protein